MQLFRCQGCQSALHFENNQCVTCGRAVGFLQDWFGMSALEGGPSSFEALGAHRARYRYCDNAQHGVCNWLVPDVLPERFCESCRLNRMIPDLSMPDNLARWGKIELAKRYVIRSLLRWGLPHPSKVDDPERGLAFDFLADTPFGAVMTGHEDGLITLNVAEGDDAERERRRTQMHEPYRTLVGHFRHEIGHYYWDRLVRDGGKLEPFRALFGDERVDYAGALQRHYAQGPAPDWAIRCISAYASSHPWEDFAETWAHYLHIVDALETAGSYGINVRARFAPEGAVATNLDFSPYAAPSAEKLVENWTPLTIALNGVNRSMGKHDLYPFVLNVEVMKKLEFVHHLIRDACGAELKPVNKAA